VALGVEAIKVAIKAGRSVYFASLADIIASLAKAEREGSLRERLRFLSAFALLIVDEIGYLPVVPGGGNLFFQLVNARYERGAPEMPDQAIAAVLNRAGKRTGRGNSWTRARVCVLRNHRRLPPYREGERAERGELTLEEAAKVLQVSEATVRRLIKEKALAARQLCKGAPWVIRAGDLESEDVKRAADARRSRRPPSGDPRQNSLAL